MSSSNSLAGNVSDGLRSVFRVMPFPGEQNQAPDGREGNVHKTLTFFNCFHFIFGYNFNFIFF
jgi:hypothetical protein